MRLIRHASELVAGSRPVCVALGMFDGVHLGHQHVIRQAQLDAREIGGLAVAITFEPHPMAVVAREKAPAMLQTVPQRLRAIGQLGLDATLLIHFAADFSRRTGGEFVRDLTRDLGLLRSFSVGQGFHFGHQRSGNVHSLRSLGAELGFRVHALAPVAIGGETVSSTRIRRLLRAGDFAHVAALLGRPYALAGVVRRGDQLGRQLGFPTANLDVAGLELPPFGVYATRAQVRGGSYPAAVNLGIRPTLDSPTPQLRCEAHLLDFAGELVGEEMEIEFIRLLRAERKFASLDALREQIARDVTAARRVLGA